MANYSWVVEWPLQPQLPWWLIISLVYMNYRRDLIQETNLNLFYIVKYKSKRQRVHSNSPALWIIHGWSIPHKQLSRLDSQADTNQGHRFPGLRQRPNTPILAAHCLTSLSFRSLDSTAEFVMSQAKRFGMKSLTDWGQKSALVPDVPQNEQEEIQQLPKLICPPLLVLRSIRTYFWLIDHLGPQTGLIFNQIQLKYDN